MQTILPHRYKQNFALQAQAQLTCQISGTIKTHVNDCPRAGTKTFGPPANTDGHPERTRKTLPHPSPPPPPSTCPQFMGSGIANENYVMAWLPRAIAARTSRGQALRASIAQYRCCSCAFFGYATTVLAATSIRACPFASFSLQKQRSLSL